MAETSESIGAVRIDVVTNATTMDAGLAAAKGKMAAFGQQAETEYNRATTANKRYAQSLLRQIDTMGKSRAEQLAYNAQQRIGGQLGAQLAAKALAQEAALKKTANGFANGAKTAKEMAFAMRGLPSQFTDIFVSLSTGQSPMRIFLQQGGQIKDMFGGIRPALAAVGSQLLKLVNPFTIGAGAIGLYLYALKSATDEQQAFDLALLTTGNYVDTSIPKMKALAASLATLDRATYGSAQEAVQKVVGSGRFASAQLELVTEAALNMQEATGQSLDTTIKKFTQIGQDPVNALLKLNETEHFLTQSELDRVQALIDEGRQQDAAAEGARLYAKRLDDIATAADEARPHLARMWSDSKHELSELWEGTKNFAEFLAAASDKYKQMPWYEGGPLGYALALYRAEPVTPTTPKPVAGSAVDSAAAEAAIKARQELAKHASPSDQLKKTAQEAEQTFLSAIYGVSDPATIAKYAAAMNREIADAQKAQAHALGGSRAADKTGDDSLAAAKDALSKMVQRNIDATIGEAGADAKARVAAYAYEHSLSDMLKTRQAQIDLQVRSVGMGQLEIQQRDQLIAIDEDYNRKADQLRRQQQNSTSAVDKAAYQQQLDALAEYRDKRIKMEIAGFAAERVAQANWRNGALAAMQDWIDQGQNVAAMTAQTFTDAFGSMNDALVNFVQTGKLNFKDLADSIIADLVRMELRVAESQILQSVLGYFDNQRGLAISSNYMNNGGSTYAASGVDYSVNLAGGRASGGPVAGGSMYEVAEKGEPETLTVGGHTYLLMGSQSGYVSPASRAGMSKSATGGDVKIIIENHSAEPARTQRTTDGNGNDVIKIVVGMAANEVDKRITTGGSTAKAIQQRFGLARAGVPVGG